MDAPNPAGEVLDRQFRLTRPLGQGGMGKVYLAEQLHMGRVVVVKVMHDHLQHQNPTFRSRFQQETQLVARLNHPNIVQVHASGETPSGSPYLVMEYVEGRSLKAELTARHKLTASEAISITEQICAALEEAHASGVVHRDLKPENIMLARRHGRDDFVKVLDFGIAKLVGDQEKGLTQTGVVFGTPQYMAPEQARCEAVDARTDVYSLGLMLYEMLTGVLMFDGNSAFTIALKQVTEPATLLRARLPEASAALESIVARCLEKNPAARFESAAALRRALLAVDALAPPVAARGTAPVDSAAGARGAAGVVQAPASASPAKAKRRVSLRFGNDGSIVSSVEEVHETSEPHDGDDDEPRVEAERPPHWMREVASDLYRAVRTLAFTGVWLAFMGAIFLYSFNRERMQPIVDKVITKLEQWVGVEPPAAAPAQPLVEPEVEQSAPKATKLKRHERRD